MDGSSLTLKNTTAHDVIVLDPDGLVRATWPRSDRVARLRERVAPMPDVTTEQGTVPLATVGYESEVIDLPRPEPAKGYIVSRVLAAAVLREDLYFPYPEIRDTSGTIIGCGGFARFEPPDAPDSGS